MDFYITKYQGKMMQSLTPLFQAMTQGIRKLEAQEREAQEAHKKAEGEEPARKKRKTKEDYQRIARQKCIRMAFMANRCYWLSTAEIAVHILTGGDTLTVTKLGAFTATGAVDFNTQTMTNVDITTGSVAGSTITGNVDGVDVGALKTSHDTLDGAAVRCDTTGAHRARARDYTPQFGH